MSTLHAMWKFLLLQQGGAMLSTAAALPGLFSLQQSVAAESGTTTSMSGQHDHMHAQAGAESSNVSGHHAINKRVMAWHAVSKGAKFAQAACRLGQGSALVWRSAACQWPSLPSCAKLKDLKPVSGAALVARAGLKLI
jgi:hypothetical protein